MNTNAINQQASIVLKDGHTILATWTLPFDKRPQLFDSLEIPARFQTALAGYEPTAVITRIEVRPALPDKIDLAALCHVKEQDRPVIVINSARIGKSQHGAAEGYLRSKLQFPLIYWESSTASDPVVRFHDSVTGRKSCPADIQSGLIDLLCQPASV
ncbi:MAG: hypothetical protein V4675_06255 [Verrucomicrobiota bacterium]